MNKSQIAIKTFLGLSGTLFLARALFIWASWIGFGGGVSTFIFSGRLESKVWPLLFASLLVFVVVFKKNRIKIKDILFLFFVDILSIGVVFKDKIGDDLVKIFLYPSIILFTIALILYVKELYRSTKTV